jgi:hypothetical protein
MAANTAAAIVAKPTTTAPIWREVVESPASDELAGAATFRPAGRDLRRGDVHPGEHRRDRRHDGEPHRGRWCMCMAAGGVDELTDWSRYPSSMSAATTANLQAEARARARLIVLFGLEVDAVRRGVRGVDRRWALTARTGVFPPTRLISHARSKV